VKIEVGEMPCLDEDCESHEAKRPVVIFLNDQTGGLQTNCDKCGLPTFYKVGTRSRENCINRHCAANEPLIRAVEKSAAEKHGKQFKATPAPAAAPAAASATAPTKASKAETKQEEGGLWRR